MDAGFLNFHKEEDFSSYFVNPCGDDSQSFDGTNSNSGNAYQWDWDNDEQELNGDVGLIPVSSQASDFCPLSSSPPSREDFNKIMNEWHQLVNMEVTDDLTIDVGISSCSSGDLITSDDFDIAKYLEQPEEPKPRHGGKRIDMARRRYLIDENDIKKEVEDEDDEDDCTIDVETVTDITNQPVLQAGDLNSLLEQFEATETTNLELQQTHGLINDDIFDKTTKEECSPIIEMDNIKEEHKMDNIKYEHKLDIIKQDYEKDNILIKNEYNMDDIKKEYEIVNKLEILSPIKSPVKKYLNKVENSLDKNKINETSPLALKNTCKVPHINGSENSNFIRHTKDQEKNKQILESLPVELIDRIRQSSKRKSVRLIPPVIPAKKRLIMNQPNKEIFKSINLDHAYCSSTPCKDSGFSSCEEDERSILRSQPTVKNADGKLMVSLLKTNTIKKKLNLEEYKRRLQNRTPSKSDNFPALEEDENARRLRHQESLMKMAQELINQQQNKDVNAKEEVIVKEEIKAIEPPSNIIMKTLVSVGTNTEESWGHLEQILQNTQFKISPNSLISSIVEHLPKVKPVIPKQAEHGEDKTIVYLDKERARPQMRSVLVQTVHSSTRRRRTSSSSSTSSNDSSMSYSSDDSSRSRTPSPLLRRYKEQIKEVEERRVIYVGRIDNSVTREDLRRRFNKFGPITNISVHFRRRADNYGFVTFMHKEDAYEAVERGNDDPDLPQYDLSFGGRRLFCKTTYSDLDNVKDDGGYWSPITGTIILHQKNTFDSLLRQAQAKLRKRQL